MTDAPPSSDALLDELEEAGGELTLNTALEGAQITVALEDETVVFNDGQAVLDTDNLDYIGSNGILHVIDDVLFPEELNTVAKVVQRTESFSTLLDAVVQAGLVEDLDNPDDELTVFAPNNDGFAPINVEVLLDQPELAEVLGYHVIEGAALEAGDLTDGQTVETLAGDELTVNVENGEVSIDGSTVVQPNVSASNGVIHVLDRALLGNQNLANVARFARVFSSAEEEDESLYDALVEFDLVDEFANADDRTVFGPNNDAFADADLSDFTEEEVQEILRYHVFTEAPFVTRDVASLDALLSLLAAEGGEVELETSTGETVTITQVDESTVVFNGGQATLDLSNVDYFGSNGVLHAIDGVLLPPSDNE